MGEREICMQELDGRGRGLGREWVLEIDLDVDSYKKRKDRETDVWKKHTIYKIPGGFVSDDKLMQAYKPQVVSMGPYHHGVQQLLPMEEHKRRALYHFLVRTGRGVSEYRDALRGVVQELMDSYKDLENAWKDDEERFLQLMIFDGCFMIEVLRTDGQSTLEGYDENDPIFSHHGMLSNMPRIKRDMLMIENQIPLLVLKKLLSVERGVEDDQDEKQRSLNLEVNDMVLAFFGVETEYSAFGVEKEYSAQYKVELGFHALDVIRKSMIEDIQGGGRREIEGSNDVIWPATELRKAGIKFRRSGELSGRLALKDVDFNHGYLCATLRLPQLVVADDTECKFLNLMAFERFHVGSGNEVTSYVSFMALIIDTEKDVSLLSRKEIIKNFVGADQAVADLFHRISHDVYIDPASTLHAVHEHLIRYCRTWRAKAAYSCSLLFFVTWSLGFVFFLTCLQLVYAMLDFHQKS